MLSQHNPFPYAPARIRELSTRIAAALGVACLFLAALCGPGPVGPKEAFAGGLVGAGDENATEVVKPGEGALAAPGRASAFDVSSGMYFFLVGAERGGWFHYGTVPCAPALDVDVLTTRAARRGQAEDLSGLWSEREDFTACAFPPGFLRRKGDSAVQAGETATGNATVVEQPAEEPEAETGGSGLRRDVVRQGDSVALLLRGTLTAKEVEAMSKASAKVYALDKIRAGKTYEIQTNENGFERFEYEISDRERLVITRENKSFAARRDRVVFDERLERVSVVIEHSLFRALTKAGERSELAMRLASIFAWEVDFIRDIRKGDVFRALVEKRFREGRFVGYGRIRAAECVNQGVRHLAFYLEGADGIGVYYGPEGQSLRKAFLKAPLDFTVVTQGYSGSRMHRLEHALPGHPAIDYAAPIGTPIKAVANGTVKAAGWGATNGNYVTLVHHSGYQSMYLHLSRFAPETKVGNKVRQGQVIGFVGSTGLSTGPHLDFRVLKDNYYINPGSIENARAEPLSPAMKAAFLHRVKEDKALLEQESAPAQGEETKTGLGG